MLEFIKNRTPRNIHRFPGDVEPGLGAVAREVIYPKMFPSNDDALIVDRSVAMLRSAGDILGSRSDQSIVASLLKDMRSPPEMRDKTRAE